MFAGDLEPQTVMNLSERWCSRAQRCRIPDFVRVSATIRKNKGGIAAAVNRDLSNERASYCTFCRGSDVAGGLVGVVVLDCVEASNLVRI